MTNEPDIIVVHTDESRTLRYNPLVHGELHQEMPDGDMLLSILPLETLAEMKRRMGEATSEVK